MIKQIRSSENSKIKAFKRLYKRKNREKEKLFIIEGPKLIEEASNAGIKLETVFIREDHDNSLSDIEERMNIACEEMYSISSSLFDNMVETDSPQGMAATAHFPLTDRKDFYKKCKNIVILDRLQDPGNLGTILRTAEAAGFEGIISMKGTADLFSPKTVRAAAGSLGRINIFYEEYPLQVINKLKEAEIRSVCTSPHAERNCFNADLTGKIAIIIGNEANGACDIFMDRSDINVKLPMKGGNESLNAAISAAVLMYEAFRQNMR